MSIRNAALRVAAGFGFADIAAKLPMTPRTKFRMVSHSKLFTATTIV